MLTTLTVQADKDDESVRLVLCSTHESHRGIATEGSVAYSLLFHQRAEVDALIARLTAERDKAWPAVTEADPPKVPLVPDASIGRDYNPPGHEVLVKATYAAPVEPGEGVLG